MEPVTIADRQTATTNRHVTAALVVGGRPLVFSCAAGEVQLIEEGVQYTLTTDSYMREERPRSLAACSWGEEHAIVAVQTDDGNYWVGLVRREGVTWAPTWISGQASSVGFVSLSADLGLPSIWTTSTRGDVCGRSLRISNGELKFEAEVAHPRLGECVAAVATEEQTRQFLCLRADGSADYLSAEVAIANVFNAPVETITIAGRRASAVCVGVSAAGKGSAVQFTNSTAAQPLALPTLDAPLVNVSGHVHGSDVRLTFTLLDKPAVALDLGLLLPEATSDRPKGLESTSLRPVESFSRDSEASLPPNEKFKFIGYALGARADMAEDSANKAFTEYAYVWLKPRKMFVAPHIATILADTSKSDRKQVVDLLSTKEEGPEALPFDTSGVPGYKVDDDVFNRLAQVLRFEGLKETPSHLKAVKEFIDFCCEHKHPIYLVGGSVRDALLDRSANDVDLLGGVLFSVVVKQLKLLADFDFVASPSGNGVLAPHENGRPNAWFEYALPKNRFLTDAPPGGQATPWLYADNLRLDAQFRDLTINSLLVDIVPIWNGEVSTDDIVLFDPSGQGLSDLGYENLGDGATISTRQRHGGVKVRIPDIPANAPPWLPAQNFVRLLKKVRDADAQRTVQYDFRASRNRLDDFNSHLRGDPGLIEETWTRLDASLKVADVARLDELEALVKSLVDLGSIEKDETSLIPVFESIFEKLRRAKTPS